jgi:hypothetical protein
MARAELAGIQQAAHQCLVLFDGNTLVPPEFVERLLQIMADHHADVVEWHGGLMALSKSTIDRFGSFSPQYLWTLEYFVRVQARGGTVVRLNGCHVRLKPSPLRRNVRYGLEYADLAAEYDLAPFFRIGTKSGWVPDSVATVGVAIGHARHRRLIRSLARLPGYLEDL